jgi:hypothetical protein
LGGTQIRGSHPLIDIQFVDKTALSWSIGAAIMIKEAYLADWSTGDFKLLKRFGQNKKASE